MRFPTFFARPVTRNLRPRYGFPAGCVLLGCAYRWTAQRRSRASRSALHTPPAPGARGTGGINRTNDACGMWAIRSYVCAVLHSRAYIETVLQTDARPNLHIISSFCLEGIKGPIISHVIWTPDTLIPPCCHVDSYFIPQNKYCVWIRSTFLYINLSKGRIKQKILNIPPSFSCQYYILISSCLFFLLLGIVFIATIFL